VKQQTPGRIDSASLRSDNGGESTTTAANRGGNDRV